MKKGRVDPSQEELDYIINNKGNVIPMSLQLITGGKEPPSGNTWLEDLELNTVFFVQSKQGQDFNLGLFKIIGKEGTRNIVVTLVSPLLDKPIHVNPNRFVNMYSLYETVAVETPSPFEEEPSMTNEDLCIEPKATP